MTSELIWWLLIFIVQAAVLGRTLYVVRACGTGLRRGCTQPKLGATGTENMHAGPQHAVCCRTPIGKAPPGRVIPVGSQGRQPAAADQSDADHACPVAATCSSYA
jgi:hypothetical protein